MFFVCLWIVLFVNSWGLGKKFIVFVYFLLVLNLSEGWFEKNLIFYFDILGLSNEIWCFYELFVMWRVISNNYFLIFCCNIFELCLSGSVIFFSNCWY